MPSYCPFNLLPSTVVISHLEPANQIRITILIIGLKKGGIEKLIPQSGYNSMIFSVSRIDKTVINKALFILRPRSHSKEVKIGKVGIFLFLRQQKDIQKSV